MEPIIKVSFASGEVDPALWGRPDMAQWHAGCSVARNVFVNYRGGMSSRAGLSWCGPCKQPGSAAPPRNITFQFSTNQSYTLEFGDQYMRVLSGGGYVTEAPLAITAIPLGTPAQVEIPGNAFATGDLIYISGITAGPTKLNNRFFLVAVVVGDFVTLHDIFGSAIDTTGAAAYTTGAIAARVYTLTAPYAAVDLPYLKFTQSADVMTLTCVNPITGFEYAPYDLARASAASWSFTLTTFASKVATPTGLTLTATNTTPPTTTPPTQLTGYAYQVTAVKGSDESQPSAPAYVNSVNLATIAGSIIATWNAVAGADYYNLYKAPAAYDAAVPVGSYFGLAGSSFGPQQIDTNITQTFAKTPPNHTNPFARGQIPSVTMTAGGTGYTQATVGYTITTLTGSGAILAPVVVSGAVVAVIVENPGSGYKAGDTIAITGGTGATATLNIGPQTGTYPSVVEYFQQRRIYANTLNNPDTFYGSKTGLYNNMDAGTVPTDSDAVTATPWGSQVNGIQWLISMPGGLIVATGLDAWQVTGTGGAFSPITPVSISAQAQEAYGFSSTVKPVKIGYNIVYLTRFNDSVRELEYNFFANIYGGQDISFLSSHLLKASTIVDAAWSKEPNKLLWMIRQDGKGVCLTYVKEQKVYGWTRYDTNGQFKSVAVCAEPPVDAVYFIVKRYIPGQNVWMYYQERMDNRDWDVAEDVWAVDAGLALANPEPAATLYASAVDGTKGISGGSVILGGSGYSAPEIIVTDPNGTGSGASLALTASGGVITGVSVISPGKNYSAYHVEISDPTGRGASVSLTIDRAVTFSADQPVFSAASIGQVIRMGGGIATVTGYTSPTVVSAAVSSPILAVIPDDPNNLPAPAASGSWSITTPVQTLTNLEHLNGFTVSILADGNVQPQQTVTGGAITLPVAASRIVVGLPFTAQVQGLFAEIQGGKTIQGKRKRISTATVRFDRSRGVKVGANQPIAAAQPQQSEIAWSRLAEFKERAAVDVAGLPIPLFSGDLFTQVDDDWHMPDGLQAAYGMLALQQDYPLPMNVVGWVADIEVEQ